MFSSAGPPRISNRVTIAVENTPGGKAISQIILATIRKCGGVKWRFYMQMRRWEGCTLPNGCDPSHPLFGSPHMGTEEHKDCASTSREGCRESRIKSSINHVESKFFFRKTKGGKKSAQISPLCCCGSQQVWGRRKIANEAFDIPKNIIGSAPSAHQPDIHLDASV